MWSETQCEEDLKRIKDGRYSELSINLRERPSDQNTLFRYNFVSLLAKFKANEFEASKNMANAFMVSIVDYLDHWTINDLESGEGAPPYDFMVLVAMLATKGRSNYENFMALWRHYEQILSVLEKYVPERQVFLADMPLFRDSLTTAENAKKIILKRLCFLSELICSTLVSRKEIALALIFINEQFSRVGSMEESTILYLGQSSIQCGDLILAKKYFSHIKDPSKLHTAKGYELYFNSQFTSAQKEFSLANSADRPSNLSALEYHQGNFDTDPNEFSNTPQRVTPEWRSQWPNSPKSV